MRWQWECLVRDKKRPLFHFAQKWSSMFLRVFRCIYPKKRQPRSSTRMCGKQECPDDTKFSCPGIQVNPSGWFAQHWDIGNRVGGKETEKRADLFLQKKNFTKSVFAEEKLHKILETLLSRDFLPVWMICMSLGHWQWCWAKRNRKNQFFPQICFCRKKTSPNQLL